MDRFVDPLRAASAAVFALAWLTSLAGCVEEAPTALAEYHVRITSPEDGAVVMEDAWARLDARIDARANVSVGLDSLLEDTVVVWSSDVVGVLSSVGAGCTEPLEGDAPPEDGAPGDPEDCWLVRPVDVEGALTWPLVTRLPAGTHVLSARAVDPMGGRAEPAAASAMVTVLPASAPEIQLVAPDDGSDVETGHGFELSAWVEDDTDGAVDVAWASSVHGVVHEDAVLAPDVYSITCHAGGPPSPDEPCHLAVGPHVMVLTATDEEGWTSHSFLTLRVVGPGPAP